VRRLLKLGIVGAVISSIAVYRRQRLDACDRELGIGTRTAP
jgi:hypothetical protein